MKRRPRRRLRPPLHPARLTKVLPYHVAAGWPLGSESVAPQQSWEANEMISIGDDWAEGHHDIHMMDADWTQLASRRLPGCPKDSLALESSKSGWLSIDLC
jgi:hypothetical protein